MKIANKEALSTSFTRARASHPSRITSPGYRSLGKRSLDTHVSQRAWSSTEPQPSPTSQRKNARTFANIIEGLPENEPAASSAPLILLTRTWRSDDCVRRRSITRERGLRIVARSVKRSNVRLSWLCGSSGGVSREMIVLHDATGCHSLSIFHHLSLVLPSTVPSMERIISLSAGLSGTDSMGGESMRELGGGSKDRVRFLRKLFVHDRTGRRTNSKRI